MVNNVELSKEDKELFLRTLNKKGFLLEEQTEHVVNEIGFNLLQKSKIYEHEGVRREIDLICHVKDRVFLFECKKSDYNFVFTKSVHTGKTVNLIVDTKKGMSIAHFVRQNDFDVAWSEIAVLFDGDKPRIKNKNEGIAHSSHNLVHDIVKQTLKETEAYLCHERFIDKALYSIVVTNTRLLYVNFEKDHISNTGDLTDYDTLKEVPYVVFNFPEMMSWDKNKAQILKSRTSDVTNHDHMKSVFFVNINHLHELIKILCKEDYFPRIVY